MVKLRIINNIFGGSGTATPWLAAPSVVFYRSWPNRYQVSFRRRRIAASIFFAIVTRALCRARSDRVKMSLSQKGLQIFLEFFTS
jgi:hypothetical protein